MLMAHSRYKGLRMTETLKLLMIEDSEDDALLLANQLRRGGFDFAFERVETAEAMTLALIKQHWDLIISDYSMPNFKGTDALKLIREMGNDVPFIFVSGTIDEETAVEAMKAGAQDYMMKGNVKRLIPAIRRELASRSSSQARASGD